MGWIGVGRGAWLLESPWDGVTRDRVMPLQRKQEGEVSWVRVKEGFGGCEGQGVVIIVVRVRGLSESAGLTFRGVHAVCGAHSALRCRCACLFTSYCGGAIKF